jgi:hypothetical protein
MNEPEPASLQWLWFGGISDACDYGNRGEAV